jgi:hypothetical protein
MPTPAGSENAPPDFLMHQASGTSANPASTPMEMYAVRAGSWNLMFHGVAFLNAVQQTGPRGTDKFFSANWFMGMAEHRLGEGNLMFRAMLSLEPATITERRYPELFQTGETAFGKPIVDGQHPHDLFMELSLQYMRELGEKTIFDLYLAPVGDPALGPVAFPHRASASELPQAPLGHHLQDSSHIANEVITAGIKHGMWRLEASGFHGAEPNENRWNIDHGAINSWSTRLTLTPTPNWSAQASVGRLRKPEAIEAGDVVRSTASITYNRTFDGGHWATSLIWGRNHKTPERKNLNSYLLESLMQFRQQNYLTGRVELLDRDELFAGSVFRIAAYMLGYTRDFHLLRQLQTGLGANFTVYTIPEAIRPFYGDHPASFYVFLRARLKGNEDHMKHRHGH